MPRIIPAGLGRPSSDRLRLTIGVLREAETRTSAVFFLTTAVSTGAAAGRREDHYGAGPAGGVIRVRLARSQLNPRRQIPTTKAVAAKKAAKMAIGPVMLGPPLPGGRAVGSAKAVAVPATASSSSARAVPVAAAAVSISGGKVGVPAGPLGEPEGEAETVELAAAAVALAVDAVGEVATAVGLETTVAVRVGVFVEVAGVTGVGEGP